MYTTDQKQACKPYKQLNTRKQGVSCWQHQKQLVGLAVHLAALTPTQNKRKYINALVIAYLIDFEQLFAKAKRGCPKETKKTYFKAYKHNFKGLNNGSSTCTH
jgi:hypothetical protein